MGLMVRYVDVPEDAQEEAVFNADSGQTFAAAQQLAFGAEDTPWATLEPGSWALDGTRKLLRDQPAQIGWWSEARTNEDGRFTEPPILSVSFPAFYSASGITFRFWPSLHHWCSELAVTWYREETVVDEVTAYPDSPEWVLDHGVDIFDRIEIRLLATNIPGQFAKLQQIQIGQVIVFLSDEITRVSLLNEVDPSLCVLSADTMTVEILEKKGRALNPRKNRTMELYRDGQLIATQRVADFSRESQRSYTFQCQSAVGLLESRFLGGMYEDMPVEELLSQVLTGFSADWSAFAGQTVTGYLPVCTRREALQQIAFALGAVVTTQPDGVIRLAPLEQEVTAAFDRSNIFTGAKVIRGAQPAGVQVFAHRYGKDAEEVTLLDNETVTGRDVLYVYSQPYHSYRLDADSAGGLSIEGVSFTSGANWVRISAREPATVTLKAKPYTHSTSLWEKRMPAAAGSEIVTVENATLIHAGNAQQALERLCGYYALDHQLNQDAVISGQRAGQKAESCNPWDSLTVGFITRMESAFTGSGHTAHVTIRGEEKQTGETEVLKL